MKNLLWVLLMTCLISAEALAQDSAQLPTGTDADKSDVVSKLADEKAKIEAENLTENKAWADTRPAALSPAKELSKIEEMQQKLAEKKAAQQKAVTESQKYEPNTSIKRTSRQRTQEREKARDEALSKQEEAQTQIRKSAQKKSWERAAERQAKIDAQQETTSPYRKKALERAEERAQKRQKKLDKINKGRNRNL